MASELEDELNKQKAMLSSLLQSQRLKESTWKSQKDAGLRDHLSKIGDILRDFTQDEIVVGGVGQTNHFTSSLMGAENLSCNNMHSNAPRLSPPRFTADSSLSMTRFVPGVELGSSLKPRLPGDRVNMYGEESSRKEQSHGPCLAVPQLHGSQTSPNPRTSPVPALKHWEHARSTRDGREEDEETLVVGRLGDSKSASSRSPKDDTSDVKRETSGGAQDLVEASEAQRARQQDWVRGLRESIQEQVRKSRRYDVSATEHWIAMQPLLERERDGLMRSERRRAELLGCFIRHLAISAACHSLPSLSQSRVPQVRSMKSLLEEYHRSSPFAFTSTVYKACHRSHCSPSAVRLWVDFTSRLWLEAPRSERIERKRRRRIRLSFLGGFPVGEVYSQHLVYEFVGVWREFVQENRTFQRRKRHFETEVLGVLAMSVKKIHLHALCEYFIGTCIPLRISFLALQTVSGRWCLRRVLHAWSCANFTDKLMIDCNIKQPLHKKTAPLHKNTPAAYQAPDLLDEWHSGSHGDFKQEGPQPAVREDVPVNEEEQAMRREPDKQQEVKLASQTSVADCCADSSASHEAAEEQVSAREKEETDFPQETMLWSIRIVSQSCGNGSMLAGGDGKFSRRKYRHLLLVERSALVLLRTHLRCWRRAGKEADEIRRWWGTMSKQLLLLPPPDPLPPLSARLERLIKAFSAWEGCVVTSRKMRARREEREGFSEISAQLRFNGVDDGQKDFQSCRRFWQEKSSLRDSS